MPLSRDVSGLKVRDILMFGLGAGAFINEVFLQTVDRPYIIAAACALMGLPLVFKGVTITRNGMNGSGKDER